MLVDSLDIISRAFDDVINWLGFKSAEAYLRALVKEREKIFLRAKD